MVLGLVKRFQRPVIELHEYNILALIDTGALFPVWTDEEYLLSYKLNARKVKDNVEFSGFGGTAKGTLYRVPMFRFGDLIYPDLPIVAKELNLNTQMILSATMFNNIIYEIDNKNKYIEFTIPESVGLIRHLEVKDSNGKIHVLCNS